MRFGSSAFQLTIFSSLVQVKLEGDINQGVAYYKKALYYNWHYADAMYNLGVAYGEMLKFDMVSQKNFILWFQPKAVSAIPINSCLFNVFIML